MLSTVIFDLDGTLIDSKHDIIDSLSKAYSDCCGIELPIKDFIIGPPLEDMLHLISPTFPKVKISEIILTFRTYYNASSFSKTIYFDGIVPLLSKLHEHHCSLFIATNKPLMITEQIFKVLGINFFKGNIIAIDSITGRRFTKAEMLNELITEHQINKNKCIFVGDSPFDIDAAKHVGITSIAVGYGYSSKEELMRCNPDFYVETVNELSELILNTLN